MNTISILPLILFYENKPIDFTAKTMVKPVNRCKMSLKYNFSRIV